MRLKKRAATPLISQCMDFVPCGMTTHVYILPFTGCLEPKYLLAFGLRTPWRKPFRRSLFPSTRPGWIWVKISSMVGRLQGSSAIASFTPGRDGSTIILIEPFGFTFAPGQDVVHKRECTLSLRALFYHSHFSRSSSWAPNYLACIMADL